MQPSGQVMPMGHLLVTAQMSMKKGLQMFGDAGVKAVRSKMHQLHD
jgi:hypothetical protein